MIIFQMTTSFSQHFGPTRSSKSIASSRGGRKNDENKPDGKDNSGKKSSTSASTTGAKKELSPKAKKPEADAGGSEKAAEKVNVIEQLGELELEASTVVPWRPTNPRPSSKKGLPLAPPVAPSRRQSSKTVSKFGTSAGLDGSSTNGGATAGGKKDVAREERSIILPTPNRFHCEIEKKKKKKKTEKVLRVVNLMSLLTFSHN